MTKLHAKPYNPDATGFYFDSAEEYEEKAEGLTDPFGSPVEEFMIQFIDGDEVELALFKLLQVAQYNLTAYFDILDEIEDDDYAYVKLSALDGEGVNISDPYDIPGMLGDIHVFEGRGRDYAEHYAEETGLLIHEVPRYQGDPNPRRERHPLAAFVDWSRYWEELRIDGPMTEIFDETTGTMYVVEIVL